MPKRTKMRSVWFSVGFEVQEGVRHRPPHTHGLVRFTGVSSHDMLEDRLDGLGHVGVGDSDEVVVHRYIL